MKPYLIRLTRGKIALISPADAPFICCNRWFAVKASADWYAARDIKIKGRQFRIYMHRFLLGCVGKEQGHHKNQNTLDNQRENLEKCSQSTNLSYRKWGC